AKTKHEIGCHTFSHIDCSDQNCPDEVFASEITACQKAANKWGIQLKSFVHPGHTIGHIKNLAQFDFTSFRTDYKDTIGYPQLHEAGIWELKNSAQIEYRKGWSSKYQIWRLSTIVNRAIKAKAVCNLWFHPQITDDDFVTKVFEGFFEYLNNHRNEVWITTMYEYISYLNGQYL
ncbi:MAG: polysaccharide deacetylase, partial [Candidatus Cloacimonetes bacterium]|nr:polysaccharide deacetylase [Candidatus Cloacimonadota bacterium]